MSKSRKPAPTTHCRVTPLHWSQYLEGEFSTAECRRCETHLKTCPTCRAKLKGVRRAISGCQAARDTAVPAAVRASAKRRARAVLSRSRR